MPAQAAYQPPFTLTSEIVSLVADIAEKIGRLSAKPDFDMSLRLRRINRIRSITGSLAIEGNTLTEAQITAILDGKLVLAPPREVQAARNALAVYERLSEWNGLKEADLFASHQQLMLGLLDFPGAYRQGGVGVRAGDKVHMAPPASRVPMLMSQLFDWLRSNPEHPLIASSIFHYELEFIHPFEDGNGRMGRLWQTLLLSRWQPAFAWLPVESLVHQQQAVYYKSLSDSTAATDYAPFIRFMLGCIHEAVRRVVDRIDTPVEMRVKTPVKQLKTPQRILLLLQKQPELTLAEVAEAIGVSLSAVERAAIKLQQEGKLRHHGSKKKGTWEVTE